VTRRARLSLVIGLAVAVAASGVTVAAVTSPTSRTCWATLVPAYVAPHEVVELTRGDRYPAIITVNPASGPGERMQPAYRDAVGRAQDAGSKVIGYVSTDYGNRPTADVLAEADRYRRWYGVDGIFLDETSHRAADVEHYRTIAAALRTAGLHLVVINPGVVPARAYFDLADVVVTFEGPFADYRAALARAPAWLARRPASAIAHLVYGASAQEAATVAALRPHAGYVYVTAGLMPDPWGSTPGYPPPATGAACS
jgi:hypothetical protein